MDLFSIYRPIYILVRYLMDKRRTVTKSLQFTNIKICVKICKTPTVFKEDVNEIFFE